MYESAVEALLTSAEPAIRWKVCSRVLGQPAESREMTALREEVRNSAVVRRLLAPVDAAEPPAVSAKWQGAHWVLGALADLGYPPGDEALHPLREQVLGTWLHETYHRDAEIAAKSAPSTCSSRCGLPTAGRPRPGSTAPRPRSHCIMTVLTGAARAHDGPTSWSPPTRWPCCAPQAASTRDRGRGGARLASPPGSWVHTGQT